MTGTNLYEVVGICDFDGYTFAMCTTMDKAIKAKKNAGTICRIK